MNKKITSNEFEIPEGVLYTAKSYFVDRFEPGVEKIILPSYTLPSGDISYGLRNDYTLGYSRMYSNKKRLLLNLKKRFRHRELGDDFLYVNFRDYSPENWAHSLDFYLPFALHLINDEDVKSYGKPLCFVVPHSTPAHIKKVFDLFEVNWISSSEILRGDFVSVEFNPFGCIRSFSRSWLESYFFNQDAYKELDRKQEFHACKVFMSRQDTRKVSNEAAVEKYLTDRGYIKKYAEDLSISEQFQIYMHASHIVAVHGASIAPLLYRNIRHERLKLVEVFNPGHMTNFYRGIAHSTRTHWVGVRGRISPDIVGDAYDFTKTYIKHSLKDFTVDLDSLDCALAHLERV